MKDIYPEKTNEPTTHPLVGERSFIFVRTAGMRIGPEVLVLELFREIFFDRWYGAVKQKDLDPEAMDENKNEIFTIPEKAVLYALQGKRKDTPQSRVRNLYAPAYWPLVRSAWLRKRSDRVVYNMLLNGAIRQHLWGKGTDSKDMQNEAGEFVEKFYRALLGEGEKQSDVLFAALNQDSKELFEETIDVKARIYDLISVSGSGSNIMHCERDPLAATIYEDLLAICDLESRIPRLEWMQVLMTFLRLAMPIWLLAQMRITDLIHGWCLDALKGRVRSDEVVSKALRDRYKSLLTPTTTATRELDVRLSQYVKRRVELNILLYELEGRPQGLETNQQRFLCLEDSAKAGEMSISELLLVVRNCASSLHEETRKLLDRENATFEDYLVQRANDYAHWRNPMNVGQGKNFDEFFRVLYKASEGDERGGYLLVKDKKARKFQIYPGQRMLKLVAFLAHIKKQNTYREKSGGLCLADVEDHFACYGINFQESADARPLLAEELSNLGLMVGSADSGGSAAVRSPY